jgi:hypothetical protein
MRIQVTPRGTTVVPGRPAVFTIEVFNTEPLISGQRLRVLGVDERWIKLDQDTLSLFPGATGVAVLTVTLPAGIPAGTRRVSIEVTELTTPYSTEMVDLELVVPAELGLRLALDPVSITGGRKVALGALVENTGNTLRQVELSGLDDQGEVAFAFHPVALALEPGERRAVDVRLRARRPLAGSPKSRPFALRVEGSDPPVQAYGSFVQRPVLTRGNLALLGLVVAVTVFAAVITASLSQVTASSTNDRNAVLQALQANINAQNAAANGGAGGAGSGQGGTIGGKVSILSTPNSGVGGVTVDLYSSGDTTTPLASTATTSSGNYSFSGLIPGTYKLEYQGAGFAQIWYPDSTTAAGGQNVTLAPGSMSATADEPLGGLPATISGQVVGDAPADATVTLEAQTANAALSKASVMTATTDGSGNFVLANVPSPASYDLVVTKSGYATTTQAVDLSGGQADTGVTLLLQRGDGTLSGIVSSPTGPLGGATVSASSGSFTASSVSLTQGTVGAFTLRDLPTPAQLTLVVSAPGYSSQTLSVSLSAAQQLTGLAVTLTQGSGSIAGTVTDASGQPAGGVTVVVSDGNLSITTETLTVGTVGSYTVSGLPDPGTYEVTFSRSDLTTQTREVQLVAAGMSVGAGKATGSAQPNEVNVAMQSAFATLSGIVKDQSGTALGEIGVSLTSGSTTLSVTSATVPTLGAYQIAGIAPGTYTVSFTRPGALPTSTVLTLTAGQSLTYDPVLSPAASISGEVVEASSSGGTTPLEGATVTLYLATQYPNVVLATTTTGANGTFSFSNLSAPDEYIVQYSYPPGTPGQATSDVVVKPSQSAQLAPVQVNAG